MLKKDFENLKTIRQQTRCANAEQMTNKKKAKGSIEKFLFAQTKDLFSVLQAQPQKRG